MQISGGAKLESYMADLAKRVTSASKVSVGFFADATYPNGTSVAMVAAIQNFGTPSRGIPPRPFFSNMIERDASKWGPQTAALLNANGGDAARTLGQMGEVIAADLKQSIVDTNDPADSPVTDLLKERFPMGGQTFGDVLQARRDVANGITAPASKPLVQTGVMLNSVGSRVE